MKCGASDLNEARLIPVVSKFRDGSVADPSDEFIDGCERNQKPLARLDRPAKAVTG